MPSTPGLQSPSNANGKNAIGPCSNKAPVAVVDMFRSRRGGLRPLPRKDPELARSPGSMASMRSYSKDVAEACRLAKTMQVPVAEMQRSYTLFRDHAEPLAPGAEMIRDGRLGQEQFAKLVRNNLIADGDILAEQSINKVAGCVKRVCKSAGVDRDRALSFDEFVECMRILSFDYAFDVTHEERELRRMAQKYNLDPVEVDRYKHMFDELDENGSGKIDNQEFENLLYNCSNLGQDIGLSGARRPPLWLLDLPSNYDGSIDFEEFLTFNLNCLAQEADGFSRYFGRCGVRSPKGLQARPIPGEASASKHKRVGADHCA
jgi:Ca2+-binding EF-hand superfamily protein